MTPKRWTRALKACTPQLHQNAVPPKFPKNRTDASQLGNKTDTNLGNQDHFFLSSYTGVRFLTINIKHGIQLKTCKSIHKLNLKLKRNHQTRQVYFYAIDNSNTDAGKFLKSRETIIGSNSLNPYLSPAQPNKKQILFPSLTFF